MEDEYCKSCASRAICGKACPELAAHLRRFDVPLREKSISEPKYGQSWPQILRKRARVLSPRDRQILKFLLSGYSYKRIEIELSVTSGALRVAISRIKSKLWKKSIM